MNGKNNVFLEKIRKTFVFPTANAHVFSLTKKGGKLVLPLFPPPFLLPKSKRLGEEEALLLSLLA